MQPIWFPCIIFYLFLFSLACLIVHRHKTFFISFGHNLLRTQRAVVEFFWTGGQQLEGSSDPHHDCSIESLPIVSKSDLACWEFNILWSLKLYDHVCKPLVLWDVITALLDFKQSASKYVEQILSKWISSWLLGCHSQLSLEKILLCAPSLLSIASSRQMHLLNIICRRLMLLGVNADVLNARQHKLGGINASDEHEQPWIQLLVYSETELRQRLVAFTFAVVLSHASHPVTMPSISTWLPVGIEQMECWVSLNDDLVHDQLKLLKSEIGELRGRYVLGFPSLCFGLNLHSDLYGFMFLCFCSSNKFAENNF